MQSGRGAGVGDMHHLSHSQISDIAPRKLLTSHNAYYVISNTGLLLIGASDFRWLAVLPQQIRIPFGTNLYSFPQ